MMLKRFIIVFISVLTIVGCGGPKKPKNLISKKKMVNILIDSKLIASANTINRRILEENGVFQDTYIFEKYNIDSTQFAESNAYYAYHIKDYEEIYLMVKDSLDKLKAHYKELQDKERKEAEQKSKDSLETVLKERDSVKLSKVSDSLVIKRIQDSLSKKSLSDISEEGGVLITPPVLEK
ncbi:DUF4296 domain-containing protein [Seonamhaeicola sp.]|uniref:DUF4296 domain-containing protein n=1 Tax=Seonamhaeicola sp. TaxID=1912245 RepID=UPI0026183F27|nr:DUF4296 domain-containing protein [Seonamhaeicola sp.]